MASSPSTAGQLTTNLDQSTKDIDGGDLSATPQDYVTLSQAALNSSASSQAPASTAAIAASLLLDIASSSSGANALVNDLNHLGADLAGNPLNDVSRILTAASAMSINAAASSNSTQSAMLVDTAKIVQEIAQAVVVGDAAAINAELSQLASLLSNLQRVQYGEPIDENNDDAFSSGATSQLTQTTDVDVYSLSPYDLSLIAWHLFGSVPPNSEQYGDRETRKKLRRVSSRRFAEAQWSVLVFLAGFREPDDLREALAYIFSEESLRSFARRLRREADPALIPKWQMDLIDVMNTGR